MIGRNGERRSGISAQAARHDDDDDLLSQLNIKTFLFQTIQFNISTQFKCQTVLFDPFIGPDQVLPLRSREYLGAMAKKGYSAFP